MLKFELLAHDHNKNTAVIAVPISLLEDNGYDLDNLSMILSQRDSSLAVAKVVEGQQSNIKTSLLVLWSALLEALPHGFSPSPPSSTKLVLDIPGRGPVAFGVSEGYTESLDRVKLLEAGVTVEQLAAGTVRKPRASYITVAEWKEMQPGEGGA